MASLSYGDIFSDFLGSVTDYDIALMSASDAYSLMTEYLHKTLSQSYVRGLFDTLQLDDSIQLMTFELKNKVDNSSDLDFIRNIIAKGMVVSWLEPKVRSKLNIAQFFGGKEQQLREIISNLSQFAAFGNIAVYFYGYAGKPLES